MLFCKDKVSAKMSDGKYVGASYDRPYFTFGAADEVKNSTASVVDGDKPLIVDGVQFVGTEPAKDKSTAEVSGLVQDALSYLDVRYNSSAKLENKRDPWLLLLQLAERQENVQIANPLRQGLKPMDLQEALKKVAKTLLAAGVAKDETSALAAAKTALGIA
jgi:hypothetical protein